MQLQACRDTSLRATVLGMLWCVGTVKPCTYLLLPVDGERCQDCLPLSQQDAQLPAVGGVRSQGRQQPQVQRPAQPAGVTVKSSMLLPIT